MAKSPADRPWDAAAVAHDAPRAPREGQPRRGGEDGPAYRGLGTGLLVLALAAIGGLIGSWPAEGREATSPTGAGLDTPKSRTSVAPSRDAPGRSARRPTVGLGSGPACWSWAWWRSAGSWATCSGPRVPSISTARPRRGWPRRTAADWLEARDDYIAPLDRRFPDHPYRETTQSLARPHPDSRRPRIAPGPGQPAGIKLTEPRDDERCARSWASTPWPARPRSMATNSPRSSNGR